MEREAKEKAAREEQARYYKECMERQAAEQLKQEAEAAARRKREETGNAQPAEFLKKREQEKLRQDRQRKDNRFNSAPREQPARSSGRAASSSTTYPAPGFASTSRSACLHEGWWDKIEGRMTCESCAVSRYSYLLQCPSCKMKACASCQQTLRPPKRNVNRMKADQTRYHTPERTNFGFGSTYYDDYDCAYD
jgi:hypothetical protein